MHNRAAIPIVVITQALMGTSRSVTVQVWVGVCRVELLRLHFYRSSSCNVHKHITGVRISHELNFRCIELLYIPQISSPQMFSSCACL